MLQFCHLCRSLSFHKQWYSDTNSLAYIISMHTFKNTELNTRIYIYIYMSTAAYALRQLIMPYYVAHNNSWIRTSTTKVCIYRHLIGCALESRHVHVYIYIYIYMRGSCGKKNTNTNKRVEINFFCQPFKPYISLHSYFFVIEYSLAISSAEGGIIENQNYLRCC